MPGILIYETEADGEVYVAVDEGVLVKTGTDVLVSVRARSAARTWPSLREAVEREFLDAERARAERARGHGQAGSGFLRRFATFNMTERPRGTPRTAEPPSPAQVGAKAARKLKARRSARRGSGSAWA